MNIVKKIAVAAAFLCAATVANAEEGGMKIGARLGYSMQNVGSYDAGMLGVAAGVVVEIPVGPVKVAPEVAFLYRNNYTYKLLGLTEDGNWKFGEFTQPEFAISVPIIVKYNFIEKAYAGAGIQIDLPLGAEECFEGNCKPMDGKEIEVAGAKTGNFNPERATIDLGIPIVVGYSILPNLSVDARYVIGLMAHQKYKTGGTGVFGTVTPVVEVESDPLTTTSVNVTYFF